MNMTSCQKKVVLTEFHEKSTLKVLTWTKNQQQKNLCQVITSLIYTSKPENLFIRSHKQQTSKKGEFVRRAKAIPPLSLIRHKSCRAYRTPARQFTPAKDQRAQLPSPFHER
jgi:hypothetical protein